MLHFAFLGRILWSVESSARNVHLFKGMDVFICVQGGTKVSLRPKQKLEFLREFDSFGLFISSGYKNRVFLMIRVSFRHSKLAHCDIDEKFCLTPSQGSESVRSQKKGYYSATV